MRLFTLKRLLVLSVFPLALGLGACSDGAITSLSSEVPGGGRGVESASREVAAAKAAEQPIVVTTVAPITNTVSDRLRVIGLVPEGDKLAYV